MFEKAVEVLDWFKQLNKADRPVSVEIRGDHFKVNSDGTLGTVIYRARPEATVQTPVLALSTLTGLVSAYKANVDGFGSQDHAVKVDSYDQVSIVSLDADEWGRRQVWATAKSAEVNPFPFDKYIDQEMFLILAQVGFMQVDGNYTNMLKMCTVLTAGSSVQVADDGYSQKVVIEGGGIKREAIDLPPRIGLRPYRTFREIDPIESDFLLRFKTSKEAMPTISLIPIDGGSWKQDTALAVGHWLAKHLPEGAPIIA